MLRMGVRDRREGVAERRERVCYAGCMKQPIPEYAIRAAREALDDVTLFGFVDGLISTDSADVTETEAEVAVVMRCPWVNNDTTGMASMAIGQVRSVKVVRSGDGHRLEFNGRCVRKVLAGSAGALWSPGKRAHVELTFQSDGVRPVWRAPGA